MAMAMAEEEEEDKDKDSSVSKALVWHNLKCSPECVSCFEDLPQSYVCDWCCVAEDLHAVFSEGWLLNWWLWTKKERGDWRNVPACSHQIESSNDWFCRVHFDRWTTFSLSCATLLGHKCSASRFQHNVNARNKVREKVSLSCFEQLKFGRASVICKLQEEIHVSDCISRHLMQLCVEVAQDLTRRTCIDCCAWSLPSLIARSGKGFISTHVELERNSKTPEIGLIPLSRRKFRSPTSDNMDRWKAEVGRVREEKK